MEVIYSAKSCEEEDSDDTNKQNPINRNDNILEQISSDSRLSSDINSLKSENLPETINNLSDNENEFDEIYLKETIDEKMPSNEAVPFVIFENNKFIITNKSKILLNQKKFKNIGIISLVGKYRTGKSFLLNRVLLNNKSNTGFDVGPTFKPCTKGIWIWSEPLMIKNVNSINNKEFPCFMIDTEGLGAYDEEVNHDSKIFLIAILISSLFIFNSFGTIDENAINSLSFVLNLSKTIKLKNSFKEDNKNELAQYFPSFLWLLRDFSLKLVDKKGKNITEKQYLEHALENIKGEENNEIIKEKNRVRSLIRTYFPDRDCFTLVRPVEEEKYLQNLQELSDDELRSEFLVQSKNFRSKVYKKIKPKVFHGQFLSGSMLLELVQSILDAINNGGIPVIENSWKYVMKNECVKNMKELVDMFAKELREHRDKNKNKKDFYTNLNNDILLIAQKYLDEFNKNNFLDEEMTKEYSEKIKNKINEELIKFNKENEKLFESKFVNDLNILTNQFLNKFSNSDVYENNSYQFFQDFEVFREKAISSTPEFPRKNEMLFDKILLIIKKFINSKMMKIKVINEEKNFLKEEFTTKEEKINELTKEIELIKEKNNEYLNKLSNELIIEKTKNKSIEEKLSSILNKKNSEFDSLNAQFKANKISYEKKLKEINDIKDKMKKELKIKEEQLLAMKMNNEKITLLYEQKSKFLENEAASWKNRYHEALVESQNKENELNKENIKLKEQNKNLIKLEKKLEENYKANNNNLINIGNNNQVIKIENILSKKNKNYFNERNNNRELSSNNSKPKYNNDVQENFKNIQDQLININKYKDSINSSKDFQCKFCFKNFSFPEYKEHFNICDKNPLNNNANNNTKYLNENKIVLNPNNNILSKHKSSNNNSDVLKITSASSKGSINRKSHSNNRNLNNSNNINNINDENNNNKKYISINYDNNNNIRIDTNTQNDINYNINNLGKSNFNNINIKISNQNININRNLININSIKKITNNINLNNYINNSKNNNINKHIKNSIPINNSYFNHTNYSSNLSQANTQNFNPKLLKIKIVKGKICKDKTGKPYLEYMIDLNYLNKNWKINKRFSQFTNLYKNLKKMEIQEGIAIPNSANIFSNIGTVFSGLSHDNKILNLEKFLKDISSNEEINNTSLYRNFFETQNLYNEIKMSRKNSNNNNLVNNNINDINKKNRNIYFKKLNNSNSINDQNNPSISSTYSNNIENKLEKMVQEIKASKAYKKIPPNYKEFNIKYFEPIAKKGETF